MKGNIKKPSKNTVVVSSVVAAIAILGYVINKLSNVYDEKHVIDNVYVSK